MERLYALFVWLCLILPLNSLNAQAPNRIATTLKSKQNQRSQEAIPSFHPFEIIRQSPALSRSADIVSDLTVVHLKGPDTRRMIRLAPELLDLTVPFDTTTIQLELYQQAPLSKGFLLRTSDGQISTSRGVFYRGIVSGDDQSIASISIFDDEMIGIISSSKWGNVIIGRWDGDQIHVIYQEENLKVDPQGGCEMLHPPDQTETSHREPTDHSRNAANCVQVYFETSHSVFQNKGSVSGVQNYVTGFFNNVSTIYANENINIEISEIFVWTSKDPFKHTSASAAVQSFISERPNFNGTVGHLLDMTGGSNGGLGYVDVLCSSTFNVGYSDINSTYSNFPTYSWTVNVVTHEIGHNFGSSHTHDCVWGPQNCTAIDGCAQPNPGTGCGSCPEAPIPAKGTIMSYCHVGGNGIDFNLGFGSEPGNLIRSRASAAGCLTSCGGGGPGGNCNLTIENVLAEDATCSKNNGKLTVQISGSSGSVTYNIGNGPQSSPEFSNLPPGDYTIVVQNGGGCERSEAASIQLTSEKPSLAATITNATCGQDDGIIELTASGGAAPYSYQVGSKTQSSAVFKNLEVGEYSAMVIDDNGCTESKSVSIFTDNPPSLDVQVQHTSCGEANGLVTLAANGGTGPYQYKLGSQTSSNGIFESVAAGSHQVQVIDNNGCSDQDNINVENSQAIQANTSAEATQCGQTNGTIAVDAEGGTGTLTYSIGSGFQSEPVFSNLVSGVYEVTVKDGTGCIITGEENVASSETFTLAPTVEHTSCGLTNGSIIAAVDGNTGPYMYRLGQSTFNSNSKFVDVPPGDHLLTVRDASGCEVSTEVLVQSSSVPTPQATVDRTYCGEKNGRISVEVPQGLAPYAYFLNGRKQQTHEVSDLAPGNYEVKVVDADGCTDSITVKIDSSKAALALAKTQPTTCGEANGQVQLEAQQGVAPFTYQLDDITTTKPNFQELSAGIYVAEVVDADQCIWRDTIVIEASNAILLDTVVQHTTCGQDNGSIQLIGSGGSGTLLYRLDDTAFTNQTEFPELKAGIYTAKVKDSEGCLLNVPISVHSSTNPQLSLDITHTRCGLENGAVRILVEGGAAPYRYLLNSDSMSILTETLASGNYSVEVVDKFGCVDSALAVIETSSAPELTVFTEPASCYQNNGVIKVAGSSGIGPYTYSIGQSFQSNSTFSQIDSGSYQVVLKDQRSCTDTVMAEVPYNDTYQRPELPEEASICEGEPITLNTGVSSLPTIHWTINGEAIAQDGPEITTDQPGEYTATAFYHEDCILQAQVNLEVRSKPEQDLRVSDTICLGQTFEIAQPDPALSYTWSNDSLGSAVAFAESDRYEVEITNAFGCSIIKPLDLIVVQPVQLQVADEVVSICEGEGFQWELKGADQYIWTSHDTTLSAVDIANPFVNPSSDQTYFVVGSNQCFESTIDLALHIFEDPVSITRDTTVIQGSPLQLNVDSNAVAASWSGPHDFDCQDCLDVMIRPESAGDVEVTYTDVNGCFWQGSVGIDVIPLSSVFPPLVNVITPNEDGRNDALVFEGLHNFDGMKLKIFNQQGLVVHDQQDYQNNWKGTIDGAPLPEGVYFYIVSLLLDDRVFQFDSDLTIVRD